MTDETFEAWWLTEAALGDAARDKEVARIAWCAARASRWRPMSEAPRDGKDFLARRNNGCSWDHYVVWRGSDPEYPWQGHEDSYAEHLFDEWMELPTPPVEE